MFSAIFGMLCLARKKFTNILSLSFDNAKTTFNPLRGCNTVFVHNHRLHLWLFKLNHFRVLISIS